MPNPATRHTGRRPPRALAAPALLLWLVALLCVVPWGAASAEVRVEITGVGSEIEANIRATLDLVRHGSRDDLSEAAVRRLYARARSQIRDAMRPFGFYRPRIAEQSLERQGDRWLAHFSIDPGEPVLVTDIDVQLLGEGADDARLQQIIASSPLQVGQRLRHQEHDRLRNELQGAAATRGYFESRFEQRRLEVDPSARTARIVLHLQTGPRYKFGDVVVEQDILDAGLLERIVLVRAGEPFDGSRLLQAQFRLTDSLYFSSVIVEAGSPDPGTQTVPVRIETTPVRRQRIRLGVGYATDTELRGSVASDWRRVNSRGHSAGTELRLSQTLSELSARYRIPIGDPLKERLLFRGNLLREELADIESTRAVLGVSHVTLRGGGWQRTLFTDIIDERTRLPSDPDLRDTLVVPGLGMEKLIADDLLFPRAGYRLRGEVRGSQELLGASNDFLRFELEANRVTSVGDNWRFFTRSRLGIGLIDEFGTLPASQRFFAGGDQSVRGYAFNTLGPTDAEGNVIGGRHLVFASVEAERRVWGRVALAAFVDAGNALDEFGDGVEASFGVGVHVHTPIGTVRISVARSITESHSPRLHLTIRPDL